MQAQPSRSFKVVVERATNDDAWVTYVPALGNLSTFGDTRTDALNLTREAIIGYLEAAAKAGIPI
ncbi:MAG: type II toxin-antitoxin system HicB family antitoxin [Actinomycetota bacterium]